MRPVTEHEWGLVSEALVKGGLRGVINQIIAVREDVYLSRDNRRIIEQAYDAGDGNVLDIVATKDYPWFAGMYEDEEVMLGLEYQGTLYSITHASGNGLVSVIVGRGLLENDMGVAFHDVDAAKAYVRGLTAK